MILILSDGNTVIENVNRVSEYCDFDEFNDGKIHLDIYLDAGTLEDGLDLAESLTPSFTVTNVKNNSLTFSGYSTNSVRSNINDDGTELVISLTKQEEDEEN